MSDLIQQCASFDSPIIIPIGVKDSLARNLPEMAQLLGGEAGL